MQEIETQEQETLIIKVFRKDGTEVGKTKLNKEEVEYFLNQLNAFKDKGKTKWSVGIVIQNEETDQCK